MGKSAFAASLSNWLADTPVGMQKPAGSVVFGRQFYFAILDEYYEFGASADEALKFCSREVKAHIFALGIVDDDAHERLGTDRGIDDPAAKPDFFSGLGNPDFLHQMAFRGRFVTTTIAEGGAVGSPVLNSRRRVPGGPR